MDPTPTSCRRCESPLEQGDLRCALCGEAAPVIQAGQEAVEVRIHRCSGCGAALEYDVARQAPHCAFCGSVLEVETVADPQEQIQVALPFTVDRDTARSSLRQWLGGLGFFRPPDLRSEARVETLLPLRWVAWVFDAEALISWTADSNAGSQRSAWAPHAGQVHLVFDDIAVSASRGLTDAETRFLTPSYNLATAGPASPQLEEAAEMVHAEQFDVQRSLARQRIVEAIQQLAAARVTSDQVPGSRFREVHVATLLKRLVTRRVAFPAWVLAYRYKDRLYRAVISGQNEAFLQGNAPWSLPRILGVAAAALLILGLVLLLVTA